MQDGSRRVWIPSPEVSGTMTTTYDPDHVSYYDDRDLRVEMSRVFELCHGCRLCFNLCPAFPTLFDAIDARDGEVSELTRSEQDQVVDECYQCKLCYVKCPYVPPHDWALDFPRLMMRANAVKHVAQPGGIRERLADQVLGRTDLVGRLSSAAAPLANAVIGSPGSVARRVMDKAAGIASQRVLPPYARERFTTWFHRRVPPIMVQSLPEGSPAAGSPAVGSPAAGNPGAGNPAVGSPVAGSPAVGDRPGDEQPSHAGESDRGVAVFATCFIEYMEPGIGKDLVKVYEHNQIPCEIPPGTRCCGAPWLHGGDVRKFRRAAEHNVEALFSLAASGVPIIVAQPTCGYVLRQDYPRYLKSTQAKVVAGQVFDACEYLSRMESLGRGTLRTDFTGEVPAKVTYHVACHLRAQSIGVRAQDLLRTAGMDVSLVERCSGIDGTWGYRSANYDLARKVAQPLARGIESAAGDAVCGDCHLANGAIFEETGERSRHPIQLLARAYGIPEER